METSISLFDIVIMVNTHSVSVWMGGQRVALRTIDTPSGSFDISQRRSLLHVALREVLHQLPKGLSTTLVIGAPWVTYHMRTIRHDREADFVFTPELEQTLANQERQKIRDHVGVYSDRLLHLHMQQYSLNGHVVPNPFGKKCKEITIHTLISLVDHVVVDEFSHTIENTLGIDEVYAQSLWHYWAAQGDTLPPAIVLLVGEITTDVMLAQKGIVLATSSLPVGHGSLQHQTIDPLHRSQDQEKNNKLFESRLISELHVLCNSWSHDRSIPENFILLFDRHKVSVDIDYITQDINTWSLLTKKAQVQYRIFPK